MSVILQNAPVDEPFYQFLDKKRSEGKPYYVYMTAGANKFLKRYYAKVVEHLNVLWKTETDSAQSNTDLGGIAAFICIPALLAQAVKDAAGAASPFISYRTVVCQSGIEFLNEYNLFSFCSEYLFASYAPP